MIEFSPVKRLTIPEILEHPFFSAQAPCEFDELDFETTAEPSKPPTNHEPGLLPAFGQKEEIKIDEELLFAEAEKQTSPFGEPEKEKSDSPKFGGVPAMVENPFAPIKEEP